MGLELEKILDSGVAVNYWNIGATDIDWVNNCQFVHLDGYLTKKDRDEGKKKATRRMETLTLELDTESELHTQIYVAIKALDVWSASTDILESGQ